MQGIAIFRNHAEIKASIERNEIEADSVWIVMPQSGRASGLSHVQTLDRAEAPSGDNGRTVERRTIETILDVSEKESAERFRDAIPAAIRACGSQIAPNQPFVVPGGMIAAMVRKIDAIVANAAEFNAGAVHAHVETPTPAYIPVDPASLAGIVNVILTDKLATLRRVIKGGILPAARGEDGFGESNIRSILTSSAYKGIDKLSPTPAIADTIRSAMNEAAELIGAIKAFAFPKGSAERTQADVGTFAANLPTRAIDSAIGQIAPPGHPVWSEIMPSGTPDHAADLATPGAEASPADALDDLSGLV